MPSPDRQDLETLLHWLRKGDQHRRSLAAERLARLESDEAIPLLDDLLESRSARVREAAALALAGMVRLTTVPSLVKALDDRNARVVYCATLGLRSLRHPSSLEGLLKVLELEETTPVWRRPFRLSIDKDVRPLAAGALADLEVPGAQETLLRLIRVTAKKDRWVRSAAVHALLRSAQPEIERAAWQVAEEAGIEILAGRRAEVIPKGWRAEFGERMSDDSNVRFVVWNHVGYADLGTVILVALDDRMLGVGTAVTWTFPAIPQFEGGEITESDYSEYGGVTTDQIEVSESSLEIEHQGVRWSVVELGEPPAGAPFRPYLRELAELIGGEGVA